MQAINDIKDLTVHTLPPILVLTGEDVGQFEWLKKDILQKIAYDPSDLVRPDDCQKTCFDR